MLSKVVLLAAAIALVASAVSAEPALARPGNGKGHGNEATLSVSPNPVPAGTAFTISGSGFRANRPVVLVVPLHLPYDTVMADGSGSFSFVYSRPLEPATHPVLAYQERGNKMVLMAYTWITVTP